jgi:hypothetical protein
MNININREDSNINDFLIIFDQMKVRPNRLIVHDSFSGQSFDKIIKKNIKEGEKLSSNYVTEFIPSDDDYIVNKKVLIQLDDNLWISYIEINSQSESFLVNDVCIFYKDEEQTEIVNKIISEISECILDYENDTFDKINTLSVTNGALDIEPLKINFDIDIDLMYDSKSLKKTEKLIKSIKKKDKGISILHGERGVGKTTIGKYIASKVDRMTIFIPNNMVDQSVNNPEFRSFIKKFDKLLLVIDDCEFLYSPMYGKMSYFTNNILQLVDGFLSDHLSLQILLIFNSEYDEIDETLIESNNLIDTIEFGLIDVDLANELSKEIGKSKGIKNDCRLVDVFNGGASGSKKTIGLR